MTDAAKKAAQRKRRKDGFEEVRALINMPKFISWLVWDGWIREEDVGKPGAIKAALEDFLREQYEHSISDDPAPQYAHGFFGAEYVALRDKPREVVGLLDREGAYDWREPPTRYLITRRTAVLRRAVPPHASPPPEPADFPPGAPMPYDLELPNPEREETVTVKPGVWNGEPCGMMPWQEDDYDPEADIEESSADLSDDAMADCFDSDGYEQ